MQKATISGRNINIDAIHIIAAVMIVFTHASRIADASVAETWPLYYFSRAGVPLFLMANGYFLLQKSGVGYGYVFQKIKHVLIVGISYPFIFACIRCVLNGFSPAYFMDCVNWWVQRGNFSTFWYLGTYCVILLGLPLLIKIYGNKHGETVALCVFAALCLAVRTIDEVSLRETGMFFQERIPQTFRLWNWFLYFCLGGVVGRHALANRIQIKIAVPICVFLSILSVLYMNNLLRVRTSIYNAEYMYNSPLVIAWCFLLFVLLMRIKYPAQSARRIYVLRTCSFFTYAVQRLLLDRLIPVLKSGFNLDPLTLAIVASVVVILICTAVALLIKRIPVLSKMLLY